MSSNLARFIADDDLVMLIRYLISFSLINSRYKYPPYSLMSQKQADILFFILLYFLVLDDLFLFKSNYFALVVDLRYTILTYKEQKVDSILVV